MRATIVLARLMALKKTRVRSVTFDEEGLVVDVEPSPHVARCSGCFCRVRAAYDRRPRTWRHLDALGMKVTLRYSLRRVSCPHCGVKVELVPWAETASWFTREFEDTVAYFAQRSDQTTVADVMRIAWPTVGKIVQRVVARRLPGDRLDGLAHVGVDELSYRKHHEYITVVVDHGSGRVVWMRPGRNAETLRAFFEDLGPERAAKLKTVTVDMSASYGQAIRESAPQAEIVIDRFHAQRLVHDALDEVRREQVREVRGTDEARALKRTRWALQKNPWNLTEIEERKLTDLRAANQPLFTGYLLKESFTAILDRRQANVARRKLEEWISWAAHCGLAPFAKAARTIRRHLEGIVAYVRTGLSNGRIEGTNGKIRTITRRAFGFHDAHSLIGLIFLCCSGLILRPVHRYPVLRPLHL